MMYYDSFKSSQFGMFTIIWKIKDVTPMIRRIFLSDPESSSELKMKKSLKNSAFGLEKGSHTQISEMAERMNQFMLGKAINLSLEMIDLSQCSEFQKNVILTEAKIPRGKVSTYKQLASKIGIPNGARAVGNALAQNPFPIIIPCHRVVKSNLEIGKYQGGTIMKQKLLQLEGIKFKTSKKVASNFLWI
ncbi:MAG: MGMT family protein [Candidatus Lokiarchaeota archaeon]